MTKTRPARRAVIRSATLLHAFELFLGRLHRGLRALDLLQVLLAGHQPRPALHVADALDVVVAGIVDEVLQALLGVVDLRARALEAVLLGGLLLRGGVAPQGL